MFRKTSLVNIVCIIVVFGCSEKSGPEISDSGSHDTQDNREVILDGESGQYVVVHAESETTWLACPIGASWNEVKHRCEGDPALLSWVEALEAYPEGFSLPDRQDYVDVMCDLIGGMTETCPNDQYYRCQDCEECTAIFSIFSGLYLTNGYQDIDYSDYWIADEVHLDTGCITSDGYPSDNTYSYHCIKIIQPDASVD